MIKSPWLIQVILLINRHSLFRLTRGSGLLLVIAILGATASMAGAQDVAKEVAKQVAETTGNPIVDFTACGGAESLDQSARV